MSVPPVLSRHSSLGDMNFPARIDEVEPNIKTDRDVELERLRLLQLEKRVEIEKLLNERLKIRAVNPDSDKSEFIGNTHGNGRLLESLVERLELPPLEILRFDGNPLHYWRFIRNFEISVENKTTDDHKRLACLIQYCDGAARNAIDSCVLLDSGGYQEARSILHQRFGQNFMIARAHIDRLLKLPQLKSNDSIALNNFAQELSTAYLTLTQMKYESDLNAHTTLRTVVSKLPSHLKFKWADVAARIQLHGGGPDFADLLDFVKERALVSNTEFGQLACVRSADDNLHKRFSNPQVNKASRGSTFVVQHELPVRPLSTLRCLLCKSSHFLDQCPNFANKSVEDRHEFVKEHKLCLLCLKPNHITKTCRFRRFCTKEGCGGCHHTLLHKDQSNSRSMVGSTTGFNETKGNSVALGIVPVVLKYGDRRTNTCAFIDPGSDTTLVSESLVKRLDMKGIQTDVSITTVTNKTNLSCFEVEFDVSNPSSGERVHIPKAWSVKKLPPLRRLLPTNDQLARWKHLQGIRFTAAASEDVELLIGNDIPAAHWIEEQRRGEPHEPYAVRTLLGWMFLGPLGRVSKVGSVNCVVSEEINRNLSRLYENDFTDIDYVSKCTMSVNDKRALSVMKDSIVLHEGHYQIALPWKNEIVTFPDSRSLAESRLWQLKRRFKCSPELEKRYKSVMNTYIENGYAEKVPIDHDPGPRIWYLPHHAVLHPGKPEKVRVVFDCAAKSEGCSLNQQLFSGPDLTNSLLGVLLRFRWRPIAIVGDIEAMFHQVRVPEFDRDALRFLWWSQDKTQRPDEFRMCVHLFGATSSPSCASFALQKTIEDNAAHFPTNVCQIARSCFYVDDYLESYTTENDAIECTLQLKEMLKLGGFKLTKFLSNRKDVNRKLYERIEGAIMPEIPLELQVLGVRWMLTDDRLRVRLPAIPENLTKRSILAFLASIYDPLGIAAPVSLIVKLLFQRLCREKYAWDDPVADSYAADWRKWAMSVPQLSELSLPRCLLSDPELQPQATHVHVFCDACESGFGAVVYLVVPEPAGESSMSAVRFLYGKSRVAPNKSVTIPRLELSAAALAVKMSSFVRSELRLLNVPVTYWTDSQIVLHSIRNKEKRFPVFVANRLCLIHSLSEPSDWRYVPSKLNPADSASRGVYATDLRRLTIWLEGPKFLSDDCSKWPVNVMSSESIGWNEKPVTTLATAVDVSNNFIARFSHYTSWLKLQRAIAWLRRFVLYLHGEKETERFPKWLSADELSFASMKIVRMVQEVNFAEEKRCFKAAKKDVDDPSVDYGRKLCPMMSPIYKLCPIMIDGVLRVGGRLQNAPIPFEAKHPAILPSNSFVTTLIIKHYHEINGHVGVEHVSSLIRERFWIVRGRASIKKVLRSCFVCRRYFSKPCEQVMAPLPYDRVCDDTIPFSTVGVDYFGPLYVRRGRALEKRYGCLFTCLKIRAIHIEVAHSLDTDSFLCAFSRFASRRGYPRHVYSDNGSNFVGAENDVLKLMSSWDHERIAGRMLDRGCDWKFSPPNASHRGGVWERLIRSIKRLMLTIFPCEMLTDEVLHTSLLEIEHIINSRPLTKGSEDIDDTTTITPNTILLLRGEVPRSHDVNESALNRRWHQVQRLADAFWKQWLRVYLPSLNIVQKWQRKHRNLRVGDLVLLLDYALPRGQWSKGVVKEVVASDDGHVRTVIVRTPKGNLTRDVRQLCLLEEDVLNVHDSIIV